MSRKSNSRTEFLKVLKANKAAAADPKAAILVTPEARALDGLLKQRMAKLADATIYSLKEVGGRRTIKMFESFDEKRDALVNAAGQQLPRDRHMLVSSMVLQGAQSPAPINGNAETLASLNYGSLANLKAAYNAVVHISYKGKTIVQAIPLALLIGGDQDRTSQTGEFVFDNPFMVGPQAELDVTIESNIDFQANSAIKLMLVGTMTVPS